MQVLINIKKFLTQANQEARNITWPSKKELIMTTILVMMSVLIASILLLITDFSLNGIIKFLIGIGK